MIYGAHTSPKLEAYYRKQMGLEEIEKADATHQRVLKRIDYLLDMENKMLDVRTALFLEIHKAKDRKAFSFAEKLERIYDLSKD